MQASFSDPKSGMVLLFPPLYFPAAAAFLRFLLSRRRTFGASHTLFSAVHRVPYKNVPKVPLPLVTEEHVCVCTRMQNLECSGILRARRGKGGGEDHIHHPPVTQSCGRGGKTERKYSSTQLQERRKKHGTFVASAVWRKENKGKKEEGKPRQKAHEIFPRKPRRNHNMIYVRVVYGTA